MNINNRMEDEQIKHYLRIAKAIAKDIDEYRQYNTADAFLMTRKKIRATLRRQWIATRIRSMAAVLLLPLAASTATLAFLYIKQMQQETEYITLTSAPGAITQVSLPDRSDVWLNAGSTMRYPSRFAGGERRVYLTGQAYFRVEANAGNPFCVDLGREGMCVKAYGTLFDVCSYPEDSTVEVVLESGAVDVLAGQHILQLHPNEMITFYTDARQPTLRKVLSEEKTAWRNGRLLFRNAPLQEVIRKLSRRYNVDIELKGDTLKRHHFRATFSTETITQALDYIKMVAPLEWSLTAAQQREDFSYTRQKIVITLK